MVQYVVTGIVLLAAVAYAVGRLRADLQHKDDCCCGCNGCASKSMKKECCEKKS